MTVTIKKELLEFYRKYPIDHWIYKVTLFENIINKNMPVSVQRYHEIDSENLNTFDLQLFLGGLIASQQTFIVRKEGMEKNEVLFAFNLLETDLFLDTIISSTSSYERPGFASLGPLFTSDQDAYKQLSASWFNIQRLLWVGNTMGGLSGRPSITSWREICRVSGIQSHL